MGARHVHGGLVRLQRDQGVLFGYLVTLGDRHFDDLDVLGAAQVGHLDLDGALAAAGGLLRRRFLCGRLGRLLRCLVALGLGLGVLLLLAAGVSAATALHFDLDDVVALGDGVALLHQHADHLAALGRRHVHAGLVRLQRDQGVLGLDDIPFGYGDFDDLDVFAAADIGNFDDFATQGRAPSKSCLEQAGRSPPGRRISSSADWACWDRCRTS